MKALKQWAFALVLDGIYAALFYLWQFKGIDGAGNVLLAFFWLLVSISPVAFFGLKNVPVEKLRRPKLLSAYDLVSTLVIFGVFAWIGHEVLAVLYLTISMFIRSARAGAIEKAEEKPATEKLHNLLVVSGGHGSGKSFALESIFSRAFDNSMNVLRVPGDSTDAGVRQRIENNKQINVVIIDDGRNLDTYSLAKDFPNIRFAVAE